MRKKAKNIFLLISLCFGLQFIATTEVSAQCPMCKISAAQNLKDGGTAGAGLNKGILYMLFTPYLVIGGIGFFWYKNRRKDIVE